MGVIHSWNISKWACWEPFPLKGAYKDYTLGYGQNPLDYPLREFHFQLVPLIPYSAIPKTIHVRTIMFQIFPRVENQPLKQLG